MFTGIIETLGTVRHIQQEKENITFTIQASLTPQLKIDQSIAHNGVCLTVTNLLADTYTVTAIWETLEKTNLRTWQVGTLVNLERCMPANGRFDGHFVQGHTDQTGVCTEVQDQNGSWKFSFAYDHTSGNLTVEKGSICVNGVSLTVVGSQEGKFSVAIIPYTYEHTNFKQIEVGSVVNLEFDIIGKYLQQILKKSI